MPFLLQLRVWCSGAEVESKTQGSRPRPRTYKKSEAKAKDSLSEDTLEAKDRNARGQSQGPRTQAQVLSKKKKVFSKLFQAISKKKISSQKFFRRSPKKKKRSSQKFFKRSPRKNVFQKLFQALHRILTIQKILLYSSRGQTNFRGREASRPRT